MTSTQLQPVTPMNAWVARGYGTPDVLELAQVPRPVMGDDDVLLRVRATSVAAGDGIILLGRPYLVRLAFGLRRPRVGIVGTDVSGVVEAVGARVTRFKVGDEVYGEALGRGATAELVAASADRLALKPASLDFAEAAALPVAGCTALQGLRDAGKVQAGQKVLVVGASGGVGCLAVQIAASMGAVVTAVCSAANADWLRGLGAHHVVDYAKTDFTQADERYDVILDMIGDRTIPECRRALTPGGTYISGAGKGGDWFGPMPRVFGMMLRSIGASHRLVPLAARATAADLDALRLLVDAGTLRPVIDKRFTFDAVPDAYRAQAAGHARGRIVVAV
jgi:NADPH:quinone reductase-like Zn-dependent oxidoreductase